MTYFLCIKRRFALSTYINDLDLPLWLPEEEEGEEGDDEFPTKTLSGAEAAKDAVISAFKQWLQSKHPTPYKFVGLMLNTHTTSFESELKDYCLLNQHILKNESGKNFLILHSYVEKSMARGTTKLLERTYTYIHNLKIPRDALPAIFVIPYLGLEVAKEKHSDESILIELEKGRESWPGNTNDYLTMIFRCLFDAIDATPIDDRRPLHCLNKEFEIRLNKNIGESNIKKTAKIINMPVVGNIVKLLTAAL